MFQSELKVFILLAHRLVNNLEDFISSPNKLLQNPVLFPLQAEPFLVCFHEVLKNLCGLSITIKKGFSTKEKLSIIAFHLTFKHAYNTNTIREFYNSL